MVVCTLAAAPAARAPAARARARVALWWLRRQEHAGEASAVLRSSCLSTASERPVERPALGAGEARHIVAAMIVDAVVAPVAGGARHAGAVHLALGEQASAGDRGGVLMLLESEGDFIASMHQASAEQSR